MWKKYFDLKLELSLFNNTGFRGEYLSFLSKIVKHQMRPVQGKAVQEADVVHKALLKPICFIRSWRKKQVQSLW